VLKCIFCVSTERHFTQSNSLFVQTYLANKTDSDLYLSAAGRLSRAQVSAEANVYVNQHGKAN